MKKISLFLSLFLLRALGGEETTERQMIENLIALYQNLEYQQALEGFQELLSTSKLEKEENIALAHQYSGFCWYLLGNSEKAKQEFKKLLKIKPAWQLERGTVLPAIREIFAKAKMEVEKTKPPPPPLTEPEERISSKKIEERFSLPPSSPGAKKINLLKLVPFGVFQFQQKEQKKGIFYLSTQLLFFTASFYAYYLQERERDPTIGPTYYRNREKAIRYNRYQKITFSLGLLCGVANLIDNFRE
jgi:tetratricopeptide (TPR) repeat protein